MFKSIADDKCFLGIHGKCRFHGDFPNKGFSNRNVFFAYDTLNRDLLPIKDKLESILQKFNLKLVTFEDVNSPVSHYFCENICKQIRECAFVVADISNWDITAKKYRSNPNVTLEIGLSWGIGKKVVFITSKNQSNIPSDFFGMNIYLYPSDFFDSNPKIEKVIRTIVSNMYTFDPITFISTSDLYRDTTLFVNNLEGNRLGIHRRLPTIALSEEDVKRRLSENYPNNKNKFDEHFEYWKRRMKIWNNKEKSGYITKSIFNKKFVEDQIKKNNSFGIILSPESMINFVNTFIKYLQRDDFYVAITDEEILFTFQIVESQVVWLYQIGSSVDNQLCGILFTTVSSVQSFTNIFDTIWDNIYKNKPEYCNKEYLIKWLKDLVSSYHNK